MRAAPLVALGLLLGPAASAAQERGHPGGAAARAAAIPTPAEATRYLAYTGYAEMEDFLRELRSESAAITVDTLILLPGEQFPGRGREPALLLISLRGPEASAGAAAPGTIRTDRPAVLIIGSQHGDEQAGKEATLRIARDLAVGGLHSLLDHLDVYAVPMPNPWGTATVQRENARGQDLNRDHTRLQTPAVAALHALFVRLEPDVVIDMHELGLAAYDSEIGLATHPAADSSLIKFARYRIMPYVVNELAKQGYTFHEYVTATPENGHGEGGEEPFLSYGPLLASYARNAFALHGAISMLFEVASSREIYDLERRTEVHSIALRAALEVIANAGQEIRAATASARLRAADPRAPDAVSGSAPPVVVLQATHEADPRQPVLTWLVRQPEGLNTASTDRWRPAIGVRLVIDRPAGYLIPAAEEDLIAVLRRHGFRLFELEASKRIVVGRYPAAESGDAGSDSDGAGSGVDGGGPPGPPQRADGRIVWQEEDIPAGTVYVDLRQPASLLAATILEPWSEDGWYRDREPGSGSGGGWYPVARVARAIEGGLLSVPAPVVDGILGGP